MFFSRNRVRVIFPVEAKLPIKSGITAFRWIIQLAPNKGVNRDSSSSWLRSEKTQALLVIPAHPKELFRRPKFFMGIEGRTLLSCPRLRRYHVCVCSMCAIILCDYGRDHLFVYRGKGHRLPQNERRFCATLFVQGAKKTITISSSSWSWRRDGCKLGCGIDGMNRTWK